MGRALGFLESRQVSRTGYHRYGDNITAAFQEIEQVGQRSQGTEVTFIQGKSVVIDRLYNRFQNIQTADKLIKISSYDFGIVILPFEWSYFGSTSYIEILFNSWTITFNHGSSKLASTMVSICCKLFKVAPSRLRRHWISVQMIFCFKVYSDLRRKNELNQLNLWWLITSDCTLLCS